MAKGRRPDYEIIEIHQRWKELMYRPEFNEKSCKEQAKELGVHADTVEKWHREASPAFWKNVADTIRNQYSRFIPEVDRALLSAVKNHNVAAIELYYKRHEGWSPKQTNENINKDQEFTAEELQKLKVESAKELSREELLRILGEKELKVVNGDGDRAASQGQERP